jgi:pilus assembly protein CpaF
MPVSTTYGLRESDLPLLHLVQQGLLEREVSLPDWRARFPALEGSFREHVRHLLLPHVRLVDLEAVTERFADALSGLGLLQPFLRDEEVEEIYVRGGELAVEKGGWMQRLGVLAPPDYWASLIHRVADLSGQALNPRYPAVLVDLPHGERFTGMLPPLMDQPAINVRCFARAGRSLADLRNLGTFTSSPRRLVGRDADILDPTQRQKLSGLSEASLERFLAWLVASQAGNLLICGEFSSGKTTLLNTLSEYIPSAASVAVLETFRELRLDESLFMMRAIAPAEIHAGDEPRATLDWVLNVIYTRANPGVIILGEIVSAGEAMQYLKAANLGRRAYSTIHGATVRAALGRLEQLALGDQPELGLPAVRHLVAGGVDVIVHMSRCPASGGVQRFVAEVARLAGLDERGDYRLKRLYWGWESEENDPIQEAWQHALL